MPTHSVKNHIRNGEFFKIVSALETGAEHGMWTYQRYQSWMENKKNWYIPSETETAELQATEAVPEVPLSAPRAATANPPEKVDLAPKPGIAAQKASGPIEIEPVEGGLEGLLKKLE